jgi:prepilin-type N-terminal cleavage/methylation domain-containing protein
MTKTRGFTLLETLAALLIISVSLVGVFSLIQQIIGFLPISQERLTAVYLTQEGLELVRNLRDTNQIKGLSWNDGLLGCASGCEIDYAGQVLLAWTGRYFKIDASGFYNYAAGNPTAFQRKITLTADGPDHLKILVEVFWSEKGRSHQASSRSEIYQWQ